MVVRRISSSRRPFPWRLPPRSLSVLRRLRSRLGGSSRRPPSVRLVVSLLLALFHQSVRAPGYSLCHSGFSASPQRSDCGGLLRQLYSSGLSPETGRHPFIISERNGSGTSSPLRGSVGSSSAAVHSRPSQCPGGFPKPSLSSPRFGVDVMSSGLREILRSWPATIDLFAMAMTHRLPVYFSPMYDQMSAGTDAMLQSWDGLQAYAFPPFGLLPRVLAKVRASRNLELTLVVSFWPQHLWFPDLLELLLEVPLFLPKRRDFLRQPHFHRFHQQLSMLQLTAFRISCNPRVRQASVTRWLVNLPAVDAVPPVSTTRPSG